MPRSALAAALGLLILLAPTPLLAQDEARKSDLFEDEGLAAESRGRYEEALEKFKQALSAAIDEASRTDDPARRAEDLARAEYHLTKVGEMTGRTSRYASTGKFLEGVPTGSLGPSLVTWIKWHRARALVAAGKLQEARDLLGDLGFLTDFWVAGSFENERGGGFDREYPPERGAVDLDERMKGKEREVGWRRVSEEPVFGYVDLDALFRPNDQCLAYALAYLRSAEERNAAVRLASDEGVKVWLNGALVHARDIQRSCGLDQDVVAVRLRKGWNRLLLKVADQTGPWGFRVRVTDPEGGAIDGLVVGNTREAAAQAESALGTLQSGSYPTFSCVRDARDAFEAAIEAGRATARTYFHLGWLHRSRSYDDRNDRPDLKLLQKAAELDPTNAYISFAVALAAEREADDKVDREENERRQQLEKTTELDAGYAAAYYLLAHYYTYSLPLHAKAEANLRRALEVNPLFLDARMLEIDLLRRDGFSAEADARLVELLAEPRFETCAPFLLRRARWEQAHYRVEAAERSLNAALGLDYALSGARSRLARLEDDRGNLERALALYDERVRLDPFDLSGRERKALLLEGMGRFEEAAKAALDALRICPEDDGLLNQVGRLYLKLEDREKALAYWKEALALNPKSAKLRRYVELVDPESRPFEDAFTVDLEPLLDSAREFVSEENDSYLNVLDQQIDKVNPDGTSSSFRRLVIKVLNDQGVKQFDRFRVRFAGGEQSIHWKTARAIRPDGSVEEGRILGGRFADLPRLTPGDIVHLEWRLDDLRQSFFGDYFGATFFLSDWVPTIRAEYIVIAPVEKELFFHTRNIELDPVVSAGPEGRTKIFRFTVERPEKIRAEPAMPNPREVFPQVQVSNCRSWDDFAKWYWNLIRNQFQMNDEMRAKVAELTRDKESRYEKVRAIYDFVITDIRYDASWEFGVHGYKPYDATAIYSRKFGDCKDKSILLRTLLEEIGVESYPVLIRLTNGRWDEDLTLPMVGHFNHCISYVPDVDGSGRGMFLDGTAQYHSLEATPGGDQGARVVVVEPDGAQLRTIPWNGPEVNLFRQELEADVAADGSARIKARLKFGGDLAVMIRSGFAVEGQREMLVNMLIGRFFGKAKLTGFEFSDLTDLSTTSVTLTVDVEVQGFAEQTPRGLSLKVSFGQTNLSQLAARAERFWDLVLGAPSTVVVKGTYRLPEGFGPVAVPGAVGIDEPFGSLSSRCAVEDGELRFEQVLELKTHRIPRESYPAFRSFISAADLAWKERIVIAKD